MIDVVFKNLPFLKGMGGFWLDFTIKGSLLLVLALMVNKIKSTPTVRHIIWTIAFVSILLLPFLSAVVPSWNPGLVTIQQNRNVRIDVTPDIPFFYQAEQKLLNIGGSNPQVNEGPVSPGQIVVDFEFDSIRRDSKIINSLFSFFEKNGTAFFMFVWIIGILLFVIRHLTSRLMLKSFVITSDEISDQAWMDMWVKIRKKVRITRPVLLYKNGDLLSPLTAGFIWPKIIIPKEADEWDDEHKKYILTHELAHIIRWDAPTQFLAYIVCGLMWFNPIVWFAYRQMIKERELACDEFVVQSGSKASDYADFLLWIARRLPSLRLASVSTVPMAKTSQLEGRLLSILNPEKQGGVFVKAGAILSILIFTSLIIPVATIHPFYFESFNNKNVDQEELQQFKEYNLKNMLLQKTPGPVQQKPGKTAQKADSNKIAQDYNSLYLAIKDSSLEKRLQTLWGFLENEKYAGLALSTALLDQDWEIRKVAAWALGTLKDKNTLESLLNVANDENRDVRYSVIEALGKFKSSKAVPQLAHALKDEFWWVRRRAAWALGETGDPSAIGPLGLAMTDENPKVRHEVVDALGELNDRRAIPYILSAIHDEERDVREVAVTSLDELGDSSVIPMLNEALFDKSSGVRREAAETMGELLDPIAIPYLAKALQDKDRNVRKKAAWAMGEIGDPAARPFLEESLNDSRKDVRIESIKALARISTGSVYVLLLPMLDDSEWEVRKAAIITLGALGEEKSIPALNKAIRDKNIKVSWEAAKSIKKIQSKKENG